MNDLYSDPPTEGAEMYVSRRTAAALLGISERTLRKRLGDPKSGLSQYVKLFDSPQAIARQLSKATVRIPLSAVAAFLVARQRRSTWDLSDPVEPTDPRVDELTRRLVVTVRLLDRADEAFDSFRDDLLRGLGRSIDPSKGERG
ncbi:MAG: hypothetical protein AAGD06_31555 [Acidobacteriota bacterium]